MQFLSITTFAVLIILKGIIASNFRLPLMPQDALQSFQRVLSSNELRVELNDALEFPTDPTYVVAQLYSSAKCGGYRGGFSALVNTCLKASSTSLKYTCGKDTLNVVQFTDTNCTHVFSNETQPLQSCIVDNVNGESYKVVACGTSNPLDYTESSVIPTYYQSAGCSSGNVVGTNAIANGLCVDTTEGLNVSSSKFNWPNVYTYQTSDCTGSSVKESIPEFCLPSESTDDEISYDSFYSINHVSSAISSMTITTMTTLFAIVVGVNHLISN